MNSAVAAFLAQAVVISLSGVMAPGPVTAGTLAAGARRPHAGAWVALGHAMVELPLMGLVLWGAGTVLKSQGFRAGVGIAGGAILLLLAGLTFAGLRRTEREAEVRPVREVRPVWTGMALTGGNPYMWLWWGTVGLALITRAIELGAVALVLFAAAHWLCDLVWLEALSLASYQGVALVGERGRRAVQAACGVAMGGFGAWFVADALRQVL